MLGRHLSFEWLGFETAGPPATLAARVARRLERSGRLAGVAVLAPEARLLALSVSFAPRPVLLAELDAPSPLVLSCLDRLRGAGDQGALAAAAQVARALDGEAAGRRFFQAFRAALDRSMAALPGRMPAADRHAVALLQLTRVLFLYFVQAKGWLGGRPAFLREELDRALATGRPVHHGFLRPLFFGTLNQPVSHRGRDASRFGAIPFLNGGLFEPHPLERTWPVDLPDALWRDTFDQLFERFHFTLSESDGTGIAPDMLGRVFEGVMDPLERSGTGTFYTPARLVDGLVRSGLAALLARRLRIGDAEAERRLAEPDQATRATLGAIAVLDPAVGSGAFLLGALHQLSAIRGGPPARSRREVVARNLFGVDINPAAVRLTELRLWLALIEHDTAEDPAEVTRLPNLDSFVRQGDSLMEPQFAGPATGLPEGAGAQLARLRARLAAATGREKAATVRALREFEAAIAATILAEAETAVRSHIADLLSMGRSATLFGTRAGLDRKQRVLLQRLRTRKRFLCGLRRRLRREGALPWCHFLSQFADVFQERGGFDLVIGNPPWVRAEQLSPVVRQHLRGRYRWWKAAGSRQGYAHQPDLSIAFLERGLELLAPGGTLGMLVPAKLVSAGYASSARAALARETVLHCVADLTADSRASFGTTTYPLALIASRAAPDPRHLVRTVMEARSQPELPQTRLGPSPWAMLPARFGPLLARIGGYSRLDATVRCHLGVKTGANEVFLDPTAPVEPELIWWAIRGRDVRPFEARPASRLLWTHAANGDPLPALPARAAAYLGQYRDRLRSRRDYSEGPEWTLFRTGPAVAPYRVVWADLALRLEAVPLTGPQAERFIPLNSCYVAPVPTHATALRLAAWLNSTWIRAIAALTADPAAGGFRRFNARAVGALPLPPAVLEDARLLTFAEAGRAGRLDQRDLDEACRRHLALTPEECVALAAVVPARGRDRR